MYAANMIKSWPACFRIAPRRNLRSSSGWAVHVVGLIRPHQKHFKWGNRKIQMETSPRIALNISEPPRECRESGIIH